MGITHHPDHMTDVCKTLGVEPPEGQLFMGVEIETGWTSEAKRENFLKALSKAGIDQDVISKHDGTIGERGETASSEIVTKPLIPSDARKVVEIVGEVIEARASMGLITKGAGVHIHVSDTAVGRDQLWRIAQSILHDGNYIPLWGKMDKNGYNETVTPDEQQLGYALSGGLHEFWDSVCLRPPNQYCKRGPYSQVFDIPRAHNHRSDTSALLAGRTTPTYEFRIFRTAKSKRVLTSYVEVVESLLEFCAAPHKSMILTKVPKNLLEIPFPAPAIATALSVRNNNFGGGAPNIWTDGNALYNEDQTVYRVFRDNFGNTQEFRFAPKRRERIPLNLNEVFKAGNDVRKETWHTGAIGWKDGVFPFGLYMDFVISNAARWPQLAARFSLKKFKEMGAQVETVDYNPNEKHLEYRKGCTLLVEGFNNVEWTFQSFDAEGRVLVRRVGAASNHRFEPAVTTHVCPGALERCGEA